MSTWERSIKAELRELVEIVMETPRTTVYMATQEAIVRALVVEVEAAPVSTTAAAGEEAAEGSAAGSRYSLPSVCVTS